MKVTNTIGESTKPIMDIMTQWTEMKDGDKEDQIENQGETRTTSTQWTETEAIGTKRCQCQEAHASILQAFHTIITITKYV